MKNYYSIPNKFNRFILLIFTVAPFVGYITMTYLDMSFTRIMQALTYIGVILILLFKEKHAEIKFPKYLIFYLFFIFYVFFSTFVLLDREFKIMYLFSNHLIGTFNIIFIIENIIISKEKYRLILRISKVVLILAFITIIIQQVFDPNFFLRYELRDEFTTYNDDVSRLYSIYTWSSGRILAAGFGFVPIFLIFAENSFKKNKIIIGWILFGLIFAFLSKQRWLMINTLLVFVFVFTNKKEKFKSLIKLVFILPLISIGLFFILNSIGINVSGIVKERIIEIDKKNIINSTAGTRILAFYAFNKFYWDHPILGIGNVKYGMGGEGKQDYKLRKFLKGRSSQIHVGYLSLFYMYGLIGGFLFLSFLYLLLKKLYRNAKFTKVWAPFLGILGVALDNLFDVNFQLFEMGLIFALVANRFYSQKMDTRRVAEI